MNQLYDGGYEGFLSGAISWSGGVILAGLLDATYTFDAGHRFASEIDAWVTGSLFLDAQGRPVVCVLTDKTSTDGVADATDVVFPAVGAWDPSDPDQEPLTAKAVIIFQSVRDQGPFSPPPFSFDDTRARLIGYIDTAVGLPTPLNGGDVFVTWHDGLNRIFRL